jgi:hypothetical protein
MTYILCNYGEYNFRIVLILSMHNVPNSKTYNVLCIKGLENIFLCNFYTGLVHLKIICLIYF